MWLEFTFAPRFGCLYEQVIDVLFSDGLEVSRHRQILMEVLTEPNTADNYVAKPIDRDQLCRVLREVTAARPDDEHRQPSG